MSIALLVVVLWWTDRPEPYIQRFVVPASECQARAARMAVTSHPQVRSIEAVCITREMGEMV